MAERYEHQFPDCSLLQFVQSGATYLLDLASAVGAVQEDRTVAAGPGLGAGTSRKRASDWTGCQTGYSPDTDSAHRMLQGYGSGSLTGPGPNPGNLH